MTRISFLFTNSRMPRCDSYGNGCASLRNPDELALEMLPLGRAARQPQGPAELVRRLARVPGAEVQLAERREVEGIARQSVAAGQRLQLRKAALRTFELR